MNPKVWEASGHVGGFSDPMVDDRETRARYRADQLAVFALEFVGADGKLASATTRSCSRRPARSASPIRPSSSSRIASASRALQKSKGGKEARPVAVPGALQDEAAARQGARARRIGAGHADGAARVQPDVQDARRRARGQLERHVSAARDGAGHLRELQERLRHGARARAVRHRPRSARRFATRSIRATSRSAAASSSRWRSSSSAAPAEAAQWYEYWRERRYRWYLDLGIKQANLHLREHEAGELAHYAAGCADVEYDFPFGRSELEGIANRTDFDLRQHMQMSGKDLRYFDDQETERGRAPLSAARHRAVRRRRSRHARVPLRRLQRGRGRRRDAHGAQAPSAARTDQGRGFSARQEGRHAGEGARDLPRAQASASTSTTTRRARSAAAIGGRTRPARRSASPSTATR